MKTEGSVQMSRMLVRRDRRLLLYAENYAAERVEHTWNVLWIFGNDCSDEKEM